MTRPVIILALFYTLGVLVGEFFRIALPWLFAISISIAICALFCERSRIYLLAALFVMAGWTNHCSKTAILSPHDLRAVLEDRTELVRMRGVVCHAPTERIYERDGQESWNSSAFVEVRSLCRGTNWEPALGKVVVNTSGVLSREFFDGQHVEVSGVVRRPPGVLADGLFDFRSYLARKGVFYQLKATTNDWSIAANARLESPPIAARFTEWVRQTLAIGIPSEDEAMRLILTLVLDWKAPMTDRVEEPFVQSGTFHIFAVDGLRIGIISGILLMLFRFLQLPRTAAGLIVIPILWFYAGLTGFPASAIRATIMMTVVIFGWALKRPTELVNSLFAAALILLLWDPQELFQAGFQLSFVVVFCIALLMPPLWKWTREALFKQDPFLPQELRPGWHKLLESSLHFPLETLLLSLAAWLGAIPLTAYYFHLFNPVSTAANFPVVPLTMLTLISCLGSLLTGSWCPALAEIFNNASWALMKSIISISEWCADWPFAYWHVSKPSLVTCILFYALLLMAGTGWIFKAKLRRLWTACLALGCVIWITQVLCESAKTRLHLLPVNGGHVAFVDHPGIQKDLLWNCGNPRTADSVTKQFLRAQGVNNVEHFFLSAGYANEIGGSGVIISNFSVGSVYVSPARLRSSVYRKILTDLERHSGLKHVVGAGEHIEGWTAIHPTASDTYRSGDDNALVLHGRCQGTSVLLLSNLSRTGQRALCCRYPDLRTDIVIAGLPTKDEPLCDELLDLLQPKLIVITDCEFPATRRASSKLRDRLARRHVPVVYGREAGSLQFIFSSKGWDLITYNQESTLSSPVASRTHY